MNCNCTKLQNPIQFIIGDGNPLTPTDGSNSYINNDIKYSRYIPHINGIGELFEGFHYNRIGSGGFLLLNSNTFLTGQQITINFN